jgi:hypothetical protein
VQPVPVFRRFHAEPYYQLFTDMPGFDWQFELSLWQKNLRAGFKLLRSTAAASISGATYASGSPS